MSSHEGHAATSTAASASMVAPVLALMFNAFAWGVSWWPFRQLEARGLHPLWATVLIYAIAVLALSIWRPHSWLQLWRAPSLWVLVAAAGATNATFNWAVTIGDVVRVVLLFYLMPLWTVLLARWLLKERMTSLALLRLALALPGAAIVLWPADGGASFWLAGLPVPRSLAEWLGVVGGFTFALNNVMLKREAHQPHAARALAMFFGGALVAGVLALVLGVQGSVPWPPLPAAGWVTGTLLLALVFLAGNLALQFGVSRLPANVTAVVMITEVLFAAGSALALGAGVLTPQLMVGGALIIGAAMLAARR